MLSVANKPIMQSTFTLSVIMQNVIAPYVRLHWIKLRPLSEILD
jgi:hypothetical protein